MKKSINSIEYGIMNAPYIGGGLSAKFYPRQYMNHKDFLQELDCCFCKVETGEYSDVPYGCPCGDIHIEFHNGWSYLFQLNSFGDWDSIGFTYGLPKVDKPSDLLTRYGVA